MNLSPLLPPRYCSYCCNVCILVLTPTCSCEGSLYYNVLFPSKYISGMPKAMKRKRLLNKQNGFFLVFQKPLLFTFELSGGYCSVSSSSRVPKFPLPLPLPLPLLTPVTQAMCLLCHLVMATIRNPKKLPRKCSLSSEIVRYMQEKINQDYL